MSAPRWPSAKPRKRAVRHEQLAQKAVISWSKRIPELRELLFHIPNGGYRTPLEAIIFKALGVRAGVYDLFLPMPILMRPLADGESLGLWVEMKSTDGEETEKQMAWGNLMRAMGYECAVANGFDEAREIYTNYVARHRKAKAEAQCDTKMHERR